MTATIDLERGERAAREGVAFVERGERATLAISGGDRLAFLHRMLTNNTETLTAGQGVRAELLDNKGRVISDLRLYAREDDLLADVEAAIAEATLKKLSMFVMRDDVKIVDVSAEWTLLTLVGPNADPIVVDLGVPSDLGALQHITAEVAGTAAVVVRSGWAAGPSYDIYVPADTAEAVKTSLVERGALEADPRALEVLRIENGVARQGFEITEAVLPIELNLFGEAIVDKGCYPGQEVITRIVHRGATRRTLVGFRIEGATAPETGTPVRVDDRDVGHVTSASHSVVRGEVVALAVIRKEHAEPGAEIDVAGATGRVTALPMPPP